MSDTVEMGRITEGLSSKSEKMRVLSKAGYSRGDIARYLGTSYQFVRNVLLREEERTRRTQAPRLTPEPPSGERGASDRKIHLGPDGQINIPTALRQAVGLKEGDALFIEAEAGELRLLTVPAAVRKAQAIVRQFVPAGVSLVDELLEDRRREVERERDNG
jgi:AbrB family looped-hinge helix DNA binding protein